MTSIANIPTCNISKFSRIENARRWAARSKYIVNVLMGDDGYYWVCSTRREQSRLVKAGYEAVA